MGDVGALRRVREYMDAHPARALHALRDILRADPDFIAARVDCGIIMYRLARYDEGENELRCALELVSGEKQYIPYFYLGRLNVERGSLREAQGWFEKAIVLEPNDATPRIMLGATLAKLGELDAAEAAHRSATLCSAGCIDEAFLNLGLVLRATERYTEALACFNEALEITPQYSAAMLAKEDVTQVLRVMEAAP